MFLVYGTALVPVVTAVAPTKEWDRLRKEPVTWHLADGDALLAHVGWDPAEKPRAYFIKATYLNNYWRLLPTEVWKSIFDVVRAAKDGYRIPDYVTPDIMVKIVEKMKETLEAEKTLRQWMEAQQNKKPRHD